MYMSYVRSNGFFDGIENIFKELQKSNLSSYQESFPPMDMILDEKTGTLELVFALAGYDRDEIDIQLDGDFLMLSGKKIAKDEAESRKMVRSGIRKRDFESKYQLPSKFDLSKATANYRQGLLTLTFPVKEESKPRKITL